MFLLIINQFVVVMQKHASGQPMQCSKDTERCGGADTGRACADAVTAFGDGRAGIEREDTEKKKGMDAECIRAEIR